MNVLKFIPGMRATHADIVDLQAQYQLLQDRFIFHTLAASEFGKLLGHPMVKEPGREVLKQILETEVQNHISQAYMISLEWKRIGRQIGDNR